MPQQTVFTPSATETITFTPNSTGPSSLAMPTVDAANPDTLVTNGTAVSVWFQFGTAPVSAGPSVQGGLRALPGQTVLLTSNAAVLTAAASNPAVIGSAQAGVAGTATFVSALAQMGTTGAVTVTRGVASANFVF